MSTAQHDPSSPLPASTLKLVCLAAISLVVGIGLGIWSSSQIFVGETLPTKPFLAYFDEMKSSGAVHDGPRLQVAGSETYDFGSLPLWAERSHTFVIRNAGNKPLELKMGVPTCRCTSGKDLKDGDVLEVAPGQERDIVLQWEIRSSNPQFSQAVPFLTNDAQRKELVLSIVGRVEDAIHRSREVVHFANVPTSTTVVEMVELETAQAEKLSVVSHRFLNHEIGGFFEARFEEPQSQGGGRAGVKVYITLKPGLKLGPFEQTLELTTNLAPEVPPIQIPIQGIVVGDILVFGPGVRTEARSLAMGIIPHGAGAKRAFTISIKGPHRHETNVSVKEFLPSYLRVTVGQPDDRENVRLVPVTVEIPTDAPLENLSGGGEGGRAARVLLETTHPTIKEIEMTVFYVIRNQ